MPDTSPPTVIITPVGGLRQEAGADLRFVVAFSEPVSGVDASDFTLRLAATARGAAIAAVTGSGATYEVVVTGAAGFGSLELGIRPSDIVDLSGNGLTILRDFVGGSPGPFRLDRPIDSAVADLNADGRADLVVSRAGGVFTIATAGPGSFALTEIAAPGGPISAPAIADLNGDGRLDIVVGGFLDNTISTFLRGADGGYALTQTLRAGPQTSGFTLPYPNSIAVGDVDGDGRPDLVATIDAQPSLSLLRGNGDGTFQAARVIDVGANSQQARLADMNGDGKLDIVIYQNSGDRSAIAILAGDGGGGFAAPQRLPLTFFGRYAIADANGDGRRDILVSDNERDELIAFLGRSDDGYDTKVSAAGGTLEDLADLNGDGLADVILSDLDYSSRMSYVARPLVSVGDGTFLASRVIPLSFSGSGIRAGDLNGDGLVDIVARGFEDYLPFLASPALAQFGPTVMLDDFGGDIGSSGRVIPGKTATGVLESFDDRDWFRIDLTAGQRYRVDLTGVRSGDGSLSSTSLTIRNDAGKLPSAADLPNFAFGTAEFGEDRQEFTAAATGALFLDVGGNIGFGRYSLELTRLARSNADFTDAADTVTLGAALPAAWRAGGGDDRVTGGSDADFIRGEGGNDWLSGGDVGLTAIGEGLFRLFALLGRAPDLGGFNQLLGYSVTVGVGAVAEIVSRAASNGATEFMAIYGSERGEAFIAKLFETALGRAQTDAERADWSVQVASVGNSGVLVQNFLGLPELQTRTAVAQAEFAAMRDREDFGALYRLYDAAFDRLPDAFGFAGWTQRRDIGQPRADQARGFVLSDEFKAATNGLSDSDLVARLYSNALDRAPDADGLAGWTALLGQGLSRADVLLGFSESLEAKAKQRTADAEFMRTVMTRWSDVLDGGAGDDVLTGGRGADVFRFDRAEGGHDQIVAFEAWDQLILVGFGYATTADALARVTQVGRDAVFSDQGETITFVNTDVGTVAAAGFAFTDIL